MTKYSKVNFVYFMQKWMDSVPGQTFLNYAYSWGAAVVILGTLFKLTHLPGANLMLFLGMGTEVFVFFISAFDRPFDKTTIDMTLDNHMTVEGETQTGALPAVQPVAQPQPTAQSMVQPQPAVQSMVQPQPAAQSMVQPQPAAQPVAQPAVQSQMSVPAGGTIIIGNGIPAMGVDFEAPAVKSDAPAVKSDAPAVKSEAPAVKNDAPAVKSEIGAPAPAVSVATAEAMESATVAYVERLEQLNETLKKVEELSSRLATDSEEMENLNRTLTGIARVYEMQLKSASRQITTQDSINEQTNIMAQKIKELNAIYVRMIEAMTTNMPK